MLLTLFIQRICIINKENAFNSTLYALICLNCGLTDILTHKVISLGLDCSTFLKNALIIENLSYESRNSGLTYTGITSENEMWHRILKALTRIIYVYSLVHAAHFYITACRLKSIFLISCFLHAAIAYNLVYSTRNALPALGISKLLQGIRLIYFAILAVKLFNDIIINLHRLIRLRFHVINYIVVHCMEISRTILITLCLTAKIHNRRGNTLFLALLELNSLTLISYNAQVIKHEPEFIVIGKTNLHRCTTVNSAVIIEKSVLKNRTVLHVIKHSSEIGTAHLRCQENTYIFITVTAILIPQMRYQLKIGLHRSRFICNKILNKCEYYGRLMLSTCHHILSIVQKLNGCNLSLSVYQLATLVGIFLLGLSGMLGRTGLSCRVCCLSAVRSRLGSSSLLASIGCLGSSNLLAGIGCLRIVCCL